jgi:hypothetical protein
MQCHGNLKSSKMSHLSGQTRLLEDIAVDTFMHSSFGTVVMTLFQGLFPTPSWHTFTLLACGWALATDRHTITTSLWLTGAAAVKHFSRFSVFLGCPLYHRRWHLWGAVIRLAAQFVPAGEVIRVSFADTTKKKAGTHLEGLAHYRTGAGSARQEYRTLRGVHCVLGLMHLPLTRWPGHYLSVPVGCELSLKAPQAQTLHVPYQSRSPLARAILDFVAEQVPGRPIRSLADGGSATKDYVRQLPTAAHVVGRVPISATTLSQASGGPAQKRRADRLPQNPGADAQGLGAPPQRGGRRVPSLVWPVAPGAAWTTPAGRGGAPGDQTWHQTRRAKKATPACRGLVHDCSPLEPAGHPG